MANRILCAASAKEVRATTIREGSARRKIALIDQSPLRRAGMISLLRTGLSARTQTYDSIADVLAEALNSAAVPCCVITCVGSQSVAQPPMFAQLQQLTQTLVSSPVIVLADQQETEEVGVAFRAGVRGYITTYLRAELVVDAIRMVLAGGTFFPVDALRQSRPTLQREIKPDPSSSRQPDGREVPTRLLVKIGQGEQNEGQAQDVAPDREHETEQENAEEWSGLQNRAEQDVEKQNSAQSQGQAGEPWPLRQLSVLNLLLRGKANREIGSLLGMEESVVKVHLRLIMRKLGASNRTEAALFASRLGLVAVCERACASVNSGR